MQDEAEVKVRMTWTQEVMCNGCRMRRYGVAEIMTHPRLVRRDVGDDEEKRESMIKGVRCARRGRSEGKDDVDYKR